VRYDCIIVGGGPAGLSAALMLGRCLRRVLVCESGDTRNARSRGIHGYLTRDGTPPAEFLELARDELTRYTTVERRPAHVADAVAVREGFEVRLDDGTRLASRTLLLATGVVDDIPPIPGLDALYGISVHHCPYCDAWEWRDQPVAVYGRGEAASGLALVLSWWTRDVVLCTDGPPEMGADHLARLAAQGVEICETAVLRLEGRDGQLERVVFADGETLPRRALFFAGGQRQRSPLPERLGCRFTERGAVDTGKCEATDVPGLYVAGDASREAQFVVVAAAEGTEAAMAIHKALVARELSGDGATEGGRTQKSSSIPRRARRGGP
jgi:thioredoxin reductase